MANVKDAQTIISGTIISVDFTTDFETKAPSGAKVMVLAGDGIGVVKLKTEELALVMPLPMQRICWFIRNAAYDMGSSNGMSTRFVKLVTLEDLDFSVGIIGENSPAHAGASKN